MIIVKEKHIYIFIFLVAFLVRLLFFIYNYNLPLQGDATAYSDLAKTMLAKHAYIDNTSYTSPPGYPFFLSVVYYFFGHNIAAARIIQILFDSLLCVLIYWLCRRLFNRAVALTAAVFFAFYLLFIKATLCLLTESLFTFFLFLGIVYIYKSKERFSYSVAVIIGLLYAALSLTRAVILLFLPLLFIILLLAKYYNTIRSKELMKKIAVMAVAFILPISIWTYRNYRVYKTFVPISTQGGYAFYNAYFPRDGKIYGFNAGGKDVDYAMSLGSQTKMSEYLFKKTIEYIKNNPLKVLRLEFLKIMYFWSPFDWEILGGGKAAYNFQYVFMLPFSIFGILSLSKSASKYAPLYLPIIYMILISLVFFGVPRFRMPIEPYLIVFFGKGIYEFFKLFTKKYFPIMITVLYGTVNFAMFLYSGSVKCIFRDILVYLKLW